MVATDVMRLGLFRSAKKRPAGSQRTAAKVPTHCLRSIYRASERPCQSRAKSRESYEWRWKCAGLARYQPTVFRIPDANVSRCFQPSSFYSEQTIAYLNSDRVVVTEVNRFAYFRASEEQLARIPKLRAMSMLRRSR